MNILITGEPHSGKSTLLNNLISGIEDKHGFVTMETTQNGERTGFELISSLGNRTLLASTDSLSQMRVSRYGVNTGGLEDFVDSIGAPSAKDLLYIDEIGEMELFSGKFKSLVKTYLELPNPFIATLSAVYEDDFTAAIRKRDDIEIINLTAQNREHTAEHIQSLIKTFR